MQRETVEKRIREAASLKNVPLAQDADINSVVDALMTEYELALNKINPARQDAKEALESVVLTRAATIFDQSHNFSIHADFHSTKTDNPSASIFLPSSQAIQGHLRHSSEQDPIPPCRSATEFLSASSSGRSMLKTLEDDRMQLDDFFLRLQQNPSSWHLPPTPAEAEEEEPIEQPFEEVIRRLLSPFTMGQALEYVAIHSNGSNPAARAFDVASDLLNAEMLDQFVTILPSVQRLFVSAALLNNRAPNVSFDEEEMK